MQFEKPLVSILCITYNHEKYISQAINSFLLQETDFNYEIVIGEDFSQDLTRKICETYAEKHTIINLLPSEKNFGMTPNLIRTMQACKGRYIALCEGDDYWCDPYKLQKQIDLLESDDMNDIVAVVTNAFLCDKDGGTLEKREIVIPPSNETGIYDLHDFFINNHQYPTLTVVFRSLDISEIIQKLKIMNNPFLADWILWVLLHLKGRFYFLDEYTGVYRIHPNSVTHTSNAIQRWKYDIIIRKQLVGILPKQYHKYISNLTYTYFNLSMAYRKNKQYSSFLYNQLLSFLAHPFKYSKKVVDTISKTVK